MVIGPPPTADARILEPLLFQPVPDIRVGAAASAAQYQYTLHPLGDDLKELYDGTPKSLAKNLRRSMILTGVNQRSADATACQPPSRSDRATASVWASPPR